MSGSQTDVSFEFEIPTDVFVMVMNALLVLMVTAVAVLLIVRLVRTWQPRHRMRAIESLSRSTNPTIPDDLREPLASAVAARTRGAVIGSMLSLPVGLHLLAPWSDPPPSYGAAGSLVGIATVLVGTTTGALVGGLFGRRSTHTSHRTARMTSVNYSDLIAPVERRLVTVCAIGGVALPGLLTISTSAPWVNRGLVASGDFPLLLTAGVFSAALWLTLPSIGRRLAAARAIPGDEPALAWSDALAARTLRDLAYLVATVSGLSVMMALIWLGAALPSEWSTAIGFFGTGGFYLSMVGLIAAIVVVSARHPERHVQRTLWPQYANDAQ
ncbi:hypothetical protein [Demequina sp. SO4-18]|uniref:hypothetical protein n=1 Tax=Demequina sp. SO4-18 TaxID=3401026 RepID=UPI003B59F874